MKKALIAIFALSFCACATTQTGVRERSGEDVLRDMLPTIKSASAVAVNVAIQYAEEDPIKRDELRDQIHIVSLNLNLLLKLGEFHPDNVTDALKIKESYIDTVLSVISILYRASYDKLQATGEAELAIKVLEAVTEGVRDGSN